MFSAAIPYQGGQNHINEQEPNYWIEKFENEGFKLFDILRPLFWDNTEVDSWYRQNMLLFTKNGNLLTTLDSYESFGGKHLVHPVLSQGKTGSVNYYKNQLERIEQGKKDIRFYWSLLLKALKRKVSFYSMVGVYHSYAKHGCTCIFPCLPFSLPIRCIIDIA